MPDAHEDPKRTFTFTAEITLPWWERMTDEEWEAMSPPERLLTKMAIPRLPVLFSKEDPNSVLVEIDSPGQLVNSGDAISLTITITQT